MCVRLVSTLLLSTQIHTFLFLSIVLVLLVNLLIAMMGDTYTKIAEIKNEWMRQVGTTDGNVEQVQIWRDQ